ncbi:MAG: tRNA uridine-5-carboxymethylaminomethyl(34) synthesis GTPase MnmE [Proteobacteria bacterium]|nr:tRNA uridine-5-carboxymethylaminomethyl(34) synthesis GTPase MnmE [Pseudomonadota bacterium]
MDIQDTIAAVATPVGIGGIGIIKISGSLSPEVIAKLFQKKKNNLNHCLRPHHLHLGNIINPSTREIIDEVIVIYMPGPASYTREDVVEIQCHSGYLVLEKILNLVLCQEEVRLAEPGEFTRRAFINGRLDLTQVEAIIDLISSRTDPALRQATAQLGGDLSKKISGLEKSLTALLVNIESDIDFPEEEIEILSPEAVLERLKLLCEGLNKLILTYKEGRLYREGVKVAIIGRPNVGKSSLLNALIEEERAIVSHLPGTTRDTIEESMNIFGIPVTFVDTAGLPIYSITDPVEKKGTKLTRSKASNADLILLVLDKSSSFTDNDRAIFKEFQGKEIIIVLNKSDLPSKISPFSIHSGMRNQPIISISAKYHQQIDELKKAIRDSVFHQEKPSCFPVFINRLRHKVSLEKATQWIKKAVRGLEEGISVEFVAFDIKSALECLGEIVGETTTEKILDQIFSEFCIGK